MVGLIKQAVTMVESNDGGSNQIGSDDGGTNQTVNDSTMGV